MITLKYLLGLLFLFGCVLILLGWFLQETCRPSDIHRASLKARNIAMALKTYANEHDGKFPVGNSASEVFSQLLPQEKGSGGYISNKQSFHVNGSKYTPGKYSEGNSSRTLADGENHWAFMAGLNDSTGGSWPLIFDGPSTPDGKYSALKSEKGGRWQGKGAIVVRIDGSTQFESLTDLFIRPHEQDNMLKSSGTWAVNGRILMP